MGENEKFNPGDLVRHAVISECVGIIIRCYTRSHRPLGNEYEVMWNYGSDRPGERNPSIENDSTLVLISKTN